MPPHAATITTEDSVEFIASTLSAKEEHLTQFEAIKEPVQNAKGFIAPLDQSRSLPGAERNIGLANSLDVRASFKAKRSRRSTSFGAILFQDTMERDVPGVPTAQYLWETKQIVPFLNVDEGLVEEENGVQLLNEIPELGSILLEHAKEKGIFGTKMRSFIHSAGAEGIQKVVNQQFEYAKIMLNARLDPHC